MLLKIREIDALRHPRLSSIVAFSTLLSGECCSLGFEQGTKGEIRI